MTTDGFGVSPPAPAFRILHAGRWPIRGLAEAISALDADEICAEYAVMRANAPRRSQAGKRYLVDHRGITSSTGASNRLEEHYAIGLIHQRRRWPRPDGGWFEILDYQVPLKARHADARVGKIDLLAITDIGRLMIIELKVLSQGGGRSDPPPSTLMEGLRYAAMVQADFEVIAGEVTTRFARPVAAIPPIVTLLAPQGWWRAWLDLKAAGAWALPLAHLAEGVAERLGVSVEFMALGDTTVAYGLDGQPPSLANTPSIHPVSLGQLRVIGDAIG
jgi:hypothetical protein